MTEKKIKIFTLSDHPLSPSGVGTQSKYIIEALLKSGKFKVISFGGAITHQDYNPVKTEEYGDDWIIFPIDGYGNHDSVRSLIRTERPDILWFMTDPRFWGWLWQIEDEIRPLMPMVYYHVWDNYPYPMFNKKFYDSNDFIATISKVTYDIVTTVAPDIECKYIPHAVNPNIFKPIDDDDATGFRKETLGEASLEKTVFFWNNRNARRKQSGSVIWWFKDFLDIVGKDKATLIMHTDIGDQHGQDLQAIINELGLTNGEVLFSQQKVPPENLSMLYNMSDCTVNISDAEGFGLATLESLSCETPVIVNMTGGLQEQVTDGKEWFGVGIEPTSKAVIGSQEVPYIYEDRISKEVFVDALLKIHNMTPEERKELGKKGKEHLNKNYNFEEFGKTWVNTMLKIHEERGSWENRKNYKGWRLKEA
jgi:glycosyltransferase involved in cell wall biosynthesis